MPYYQTVLSDFIDQISQLMDDPAQVYWTVPEIQSVVYEGLRVWGAYTNYWRERGTFSTTPSTPFYDMSVQLPTLRTRLYPLEQMVKDIQYMLLENPAGLSGAGMSGQVTVGSILTAIQIARNRFVLDTHLPYSYSSLLVSPPPPQGMVEFSQSSVFVHRASWQDLTSGAWTTLRRTDEWGVDKASYQWPIEVGYPEMYSEAAESPLKMQLVPPPVTSGYLDAFSVNSLVLDLNNPAALFEIPDEWVHAIKYSALSYLLAGEGQIKDMVRADYAEKRYQQAVDMARAARSIMRLTFQTLPLPIDSLQAQDLGNFYWRNQTGPPESAGVMYDWVALNPGIPDAAYGLSVDVVRTAPLPELGTPDPDHPNKFIQLGPEELDHLSDYVAHVLTFKCGGGEFKSSYSAYDNFMTQVGRRKDVNKAKIRYLLPLMNQPELEWANRPDRMETKNA